MEAAKTTDHCESWKTVLAGEKDQPYFESILTFLKKEKAAGKIIYPKQTDVFNALKYTPFDDVRVVIIGQDPYHGPNQAHGLCFSVQNSIPIPPSLKNIFQEIEEDLGIPTPSHGCLTKWAKQGILLLNATLTVESGKPQSHANIGWNIFTDQVIKVLNEQKEGLIFLLWGSQAQRKAEFVDRKKHYVLEAPHPSPLSAHRGFLGCGHFSKTNQLLKTMGQKEIDWRLDDL